MTILIVDDSGSMRRILARAVRQVARQLWECTDGADALAAYEAALVSDPKRLRSFGGAARAALAAGNPDKARDYYARMVAMADSTSSRAELIKARTYLASK